MIPGASILISALMSFHWQLLAQQQPKKLRLFLVFSNSTILIFPSVQGDIVMNLDHYRAVLSSTCQISIQLFQMKLQERSILVLVLVLGLLLMFLARLTMPFRWAHAQLIALQGS